MCDTQAAIKQSTHTSTSTVIVQAHYTLYSTVWLPRMRSRLVAALIFLRHPSRPVKNDTTCGDRPASGLFTTSCLINHHRHMDCTALAMAKAAAEARAPTTVVWTALKKGRSPVKRPLTKPKKSSAASVTATDTPMARAASGTNM